MPAEALRFFLTGTPSAADLAAFMQSIHELKGLFFVVAAPRRREPGPAPVEGKEITIAAGSHSGRRARKSDTKGTTAKVARAIIDARIKKKNIGPPPAPPSSCEEAAAQQIAAAQHHLKKAAHHLAKRQVKDWGEACRLFVTTCLKAQVEQEELGPAAARHNAQFNQCNVNA